MFGSISVGLRALQSFYESRSEPGHPAGFGKACGPLIVGIPADYSSLVAKGLPMPPEWLPNYCDCDEFEMRSLWLPSLDG